MRMLSRVVQPQLLDENSRFFGNQFWAIPAPSCPQNRCHCQISRDPTLPLFTNAVDLREFYLHSEGSSVINHFIFPNLTIFELSAVPAEEGFCASLLNFLEASPTLRMLRMRILGNTLLGDIPQGRIVVLPEVELFHLVMNDSGPGHEIAAHISCPSAKPTTLMNEKDADNISTQEIFPNPVSWNAIARQYTRGPFEEAARP